MGKASNELKTTLIVLLIEILTVPAVILIFKNLEPKKFAAVVAAGTFIVTGTVILFLIRNLKEYYSYATFWMIHVHLFVFSFPMFLSRVFFWEKDFENIRILIFSGPEFHKLSEKGYLLLGLATLVDLIRVIKRKFNKI